LPRATPLYRLFDVHFDEVRGQWEERYERWYGFWRSIVDRRTWNDAPGRKDLEVPRTGCLAPTLFAANKVACLASPPIAMREPGP
jgi:hypothetical protein